MPKVLARVLAHLGFISKWLAVAKIAHVPSYLCAFFHVVLFIQNTLV